MSHGNQRRESPEVREARLAAEARQLEKDATEKRLAELAKRLREM